VAAGGIGGFVGGAIGGAIIANVFDKTVETSAETLEEFNKAVGINEKAIASTSDTLNGLDGTRK
jgi:hypothetical protein